MTMIATRTGLPGELRANGYTLPPDLTFDEWRGILDLTAHISEASPWWLVDVIAYGEAKFSEQHSQALPTAEEDPRGVTQARLKQASWMASKFPPGTRVTGMSYSHHRAVAELPPIEARDLLVKARDARDAEGNPKPWSTRELIRRVEQQQEQLRGLAQALDGTPLPGDDLEWVPQKDQLTDEARAALEVRLSEMDRKHRVGFEAGFLAGLVYVDALDCFRKDGES